MRKLFILALSVVASLSATAQNKLYINDFSINPGETKQVELMLDNEVAFTALQADIFLPDGLSIEKEDGEYVFDLTNRKGRDHTISSADVANGAIRILIASQTLKVISGNSGAIATFNIVASNSFNDVANIEIKNVTASDTDLNQYNLPVSSCMVTEEGATFADKLYINDFSINHGETKQVEIMLDNETVFTALQADIFLPSTLSIEKEDGEYIFDLTDRKGRNHTISSTRLSNGAIRFMITSQTLKEFSGNSGAIVTFNIIADAAFSGQHIIEIRNVIAGEVDQTEHILPNTSCIVSEEQGSITGDVNCDGYVTSADITALYSYLLNGDNTYVSTSDVNGDGSITSADITAVYSIVLGN